MCVCVGGGGGWGVIVKWVGNSDVKNFKNLLIVIDNEDIENLIKKLVRIYFPF